MSVASYAPRRYVRPLITAFLLVGLLGAAAFVAFLGGGWDADPVLDASGWRTVATLEEVRSDEVLALPELGAFLVSVPTGEDGATAPAAARRRGVMAVVDDAQHMPGERIWWCASAGLFEAPTHGERFDRFGAYLSGPAMKGLDRMAVRVLEGGVQVNPTIVRPGPERGDVPAMAPIGLFCHN